MVVVHGVGCYAIGERGQLRRGAKRLTDHRALLRRAFELGHLSDNVGDFLVAAGDHNAEGVDEAGAGRRDHVRRSVVEIEADDELRQDLAQPLVWRPFAGGGLLRHCGIVHGEKRKRTRGGKKRPPVE